MRTALFLGLGVALLAGLFYVFEPKPAPPPATPSVPAQAGLPQQSIGLAASGAQKFELRVENKKLVSGPAVLKVREGDAVELRISSDLPEEVHLHGYNLKLELAANQPATLAFKADRSGRFEYELEHSGIELGALEVSPR